MAYTTINKSSLHMNTKLYTGNGGTNAITGVGFQPDWTWIKSRNASNNHRNYDAVRGATKIIYQNLTNAEATQSNGLSAFNSDGFTLGDDGNSNSNNATYASWNWKAGGGQGSSNTDGSINTTYTSVNTTAGFSISKYTGTGSNATIGHGLGVAPKMIIVKQLNSTNYWTVYHKSLSANSWVYLNTTDAVASNTAMWNNTEPTSSVFSIGTYTNTNQSGSTYIAYCFAEKQGYSKVGGSYTGNGNADGTFVYTGFKPSFILAKRTDATAGWVLFDNKRIGYNGSGNYWLDAQNAEADQTDATGMFDQLSNGFKVRSSFGSRNASGGNYIYMAFGQSLVGSNNIPCTAR
tara:strand:+ start:175 stop:1218 length:1044 start_codon:yes stop_codon:yes gene_type:complete